MSDTVSREPHRSRQFWLNHVERWKLSGLSKAAYCLQNELKAASFYNWSTKAAGDKTTEPNTAKNPSSESLNFVPVKLTASSLPSGQFVHVERAATELALPSNLPPEQILHWLSAIHQLRV
jgi:hypothetical protein